MTDYLPPEPDDRALADQLHAERYERAVAVLYQAAMLGLSEPDLRFLCALCAVKYTDLDGFVPPILRRDPNVTIDDLNRCFPF